MSSTAACTNCRTKYSLFNREVGCSNCALSFCKRCLGYRAYLPKLADMPVSICFDCFQKIGAIVATDTVQIITTPLPQNSNNCKEYPKTDSKWWGTNPPPSMRNNVGCPFPHNRLPKMEEQANIKYINRNDAVSRNGHSIGRVLTLEEIEERLAALRGCDVEMVRNPRSWFYSTRNTPLTMDSADGLLRRAEDQIAIEESNDPIKHLEERYRQLHREDEKNEDVKGCGTNPLVFGTTLSRDLVFSDVTEEEMIYIKRLIEDVNNRVKITDNDEERMENDLKRVLHASAEISPDIPKVNSEDGIAEDNKRKILISKPGPIDDSLMREVVLETRNSKYSYPLSDSDFTPVDMPSKKSFLKRIFKR